MLDKLPESYCILRDKDNPLWGKFINWFNTENDSNYSGTYVDNYYGMKLGTFKPFSTFSKESFGTVITLEEWNNIVNKVNCSSQIFKLGDIVKYINGNNSYEIVKLGSTLCNLKMISNGNIYQNVKINKLELVKEIKTKDEVEEFPVGSYVEVINDGEQYLRYTECAEYIGATKFRFGIEIKKGSRGKVIGSKKDNITKIMAVEIDGDHFLFGYRGLKIYRVDNQFDMNLLNTYKFIEKGGAYDAINFYMDKGFNLSWKESNIKYDKKYTIILVNGNGDILWDEYDDIKELENNYSDYTEVVKLPNGNYCLIDEANKQLQGDNKELPLQERMELCNEYIIAKDDIQFQDAVNYFKQKGFEEFDEFDEGCKPICSSYCVYVYINNFGEIDYSYYLSDMKDNSIRVDLNNNINNNNKTMSTIKSEAISIANEKYFSDEKNLLSIRKVSESVENKLELLDTSIKDINNKRSKLEKLQSDLELAYRSRTAKGIKETINKIKKVEEFLNTYIESTVKQLGTIEEVAEDFDVKEFMNN